MNSPRNSESSAEILGSGSHETRTAPWLLELSERLADQLSPDATSVMGVFVSEEVEHQFYVSEFYGSLQTGIGRYSATEAKAKASQRFRNARDELALTELGDYLRKGGAGVGTKYWLAASPTEDVDSQYKPRRQPTKPRLPAKNTSLHESIELDALDDIRFKASRIVGVYSVYLYNKYGFDGVGVFDQLMRNPNDITSSKELANGLGATLVDPLEVVTATLSKMAKDPNLRVHIDFSSTDITDIRPNTSVRLKPSIDDALFGELTTTEAQMLRLLVAHTRGIKVYELFNAFRADIKAPGANHGKILTRSLYKIHRKYSNHVTITPATATNPRGAEARLQLYQELQAKRPSQSDNFDK